MLTKQQILELYLNQIFLGRNAYGVQAAARAYFDKDVDQLTLAEMRLSRHPAQGAEPITIRSGSPSARSSGATGCSARWRATASSPPPSATRRCRSRSARSAARGDSVRNVGGYFMEEVRRQLIARFGENAETGPNSVYAGGLWVRTSYDPRDAAARPRPRCATA